MKFKTTKKIPEWRGRQWIRRRWAHRRWEAATAAGPLRPGIGEKGEPARRILPYERGEEMVQLHLGWDLAAAEGAAKSGTNCSSAADSGTDRMTAAANAVSEHRRGPHGIGL